MPEEEGTGVYVFSHITMNIRLFALLIINLLAISCFAGNGTDSVVCTEYQDYRLTHLLTPFGPVPAAFAAL